MQDGHLEKKLITNTVGWIVRTRGDTTPPPASQKLRQKNQHAPALDHIHPFIFAAKWNTSREGKDVKNGKHFPGNCRRNSWKPKVPTGLSQICTFDIKVKFLSQRAPTKLVRTWYGGFYHYGARVADMYPGNIWWPEKIPWVPLHPTHRQPAQVELNYK